MSVAETWRRLLAGEPGGGVLADLGTSTITGVRAQGAPGLAASTGAVGNPVLGTVALSAADCLALGSDLVRTGVLYPLPEIADGQFVDDFGVTWLWADNQPAPLEHPLEHADIFRIAAHPRPAWPDRIQLPEAGPALVVADAPCSGLLETSFALRNGWQLLSDIADNWRAASALLDWAGETVAAGYEHYLRALPRSPDMIVYGDDFGYQASMFLSDEDFRTFVRPRLRTLLARIRRVTDAAICFHSCGAIMPILPDLADLGVEVLNLQYDARGMSVEAIRRCVGRRPILHGFTDLVALGRAVEAGDRRSIAVLTCELADSGGTLAAPVDSVADLGELLLAARAARFVHAIGPEEWERLRALGPVESILTEARDSAMSGPVDPPRGAPPLITSAHPVRAVCRAGGR